MRSREHNLTVTLVTGQTSATTRQETTTHAGSRIRGKVQAIAGLSAVHSRGTGQGPTQGSRAVLLGREGGWKRRLSSACRVWSCLQCLSAARVLSCLLCAPSPSPSPLPPLRDPSQRAAAPLAGRAQSEACNVTSLRSPFVLLTFLHKVFRCPFIGGHAPSQPLSLVQALIASTALTAMCCRAEFAAQRDWFTQIEDPPPFLFRRRESGAGSSLMSL